MQRLQQLQHMLAHRSRNVEGIGPSLLSCGYQANRSRSVLCYSLALGAAVAMRCLYCNTEPARCQLHLQIECSQRISTPIVAHHLQRLPHLETAREEHVIQLSARRPQALPERERIRYRIAKGCHIWLLFCLYTALVQARARHSAR